MRNWIQKLAVFIIAGVAYLIGQYFRGYWWPNVTWPFSCARVVSGATSYCDSYVRDPFNLAWPLIAAGKILAVIAVILLFANAAGRRAWLKMSLIYVPFTIIATVHFPVLSPLGFIGSKTPNYEAAVWFFGIPYVLITLGIVLYTRFKKPKTPAF
jgi:hypothetical protein